MQSHSRKSLFHKHLTDGTEAALDVGMNRPEGPMRFPLRYLTLALAVGAAACEDTVLVGGGVPAPTNLTYQLEPSGIPAQPLGILLSWTAVADPDLESYRVYSRGGTSGAFRPRGETTSRTFHDAGMPHLEYYVVAVSLTGDE